MSAMTGWYVRWTSKSGDQHHSKAPRTLPQVMRLVGIMGSTTNKPYAYFSRTGPRR